LENKNKFDDKSLKMDYTFAKESMEKLNYEIDINKDTG